MTTKSDYKMVVELKSRYIPVKTGIVSADEKELIREVLEISSRNNIELQNIRDMVVMLYSQWIDTQHQKKDIPAAIQMMDIMSAVTYIIDQEKIKRGLPV